MALQDDGLPLPALEHFPDRPKRSGAELGIERAEVLVLPIVEKDETLESLEPLARVVFVDLVHGEAANYPIFALLEVRSVALLFQSFSQMLMYFILNMYSPTPLGERCL